MKVRRFFANDMRSAIKKVRDSLGPEAIILSNHALNGGIEIVCALDYKNEKELPVKNEEKPKDNVRQIKAQHQSKSKLNQSHSNQIIYEDNDLADMQKELQSLRGLLEHQLSGLAWNHVKQRSPVEAAIMRHLSVMKFLPDICCTLSKSFADESNIDVAWKKALNSLSEKVGVVDEKNLGEGERIALVGPTGVGKTTTLMKIASRFINKYSADDVAFISIDQYRIAAVEQLKKYCKIIGSELYVADNAKDFRKTLDKLHNKKLVLIDSPGLSQWDERICDVNTILSSAGESIKSYLVIPGVSQADVIFETLNSFKDFNLSGCVLTKLDEATSLGECISVIVEKELPILCVTDGQVVSSDLSHVTAKQLIIRALKVVRRHYHADTQESIAMKFGEMMADASS